MMTKWLCVGVLLITAFGNSLAAFADETFHNIILREPFKSLKAQERIKKELKLTDDTVAQLTQVVEYGYTFDVVPRCPYSTLSDCKTTHYVEVRRVVRFAFDPVVAGLVQKVLEKEQRGCSTLVFPNTRLILGQRLKLTFGGEIKARKNFCDDILGDHNIAEARGSWYLALPANLFPAPQIVLNPGNVSIDTGSLKFGEPAFSSSIDSTELFGFINLDTFLGGLIDDIFLSGDVRIKLLLKLFGEDSPEEAIDSMMKEFERAASLLKDFSFQLSKPTAEYLKSIQSQDVSFFYPFFIDPDNSGFSQVVDPLSKLQWNVVQTAYYPYSPRATNDFFTVFYGFFSSQMKLIDSWDEDDRVYDVVKGDSLWKIARAELGNPRLHNILATYNEDLVDPSALTLGQKILIPPMWKIFALNNHDKIVRKGDSFWKRYLIEAGGKDWPQWLVSAKGKIKNPNRIYPGEILTTLGQGELPQ